MTGANTWYSFPIVLLHSVVFTRLIFESYMLRSKRYQYYFLKNSGTYTLLLWIQQAYLFSLISLEGFKLSLSTFISTTGRRGGGIIIFHSPMEGEHWRKLNFGKNGSFISGLNLTGKCNLSVFSYRKTHISILVIILSPIRFISLYLNKLNNYLCWQAYPSL